MPSSAKIPLLVILCLVLCAKGAPGATYFVDQRSAKAADTNPGTEEAPFKTIQGAVNKLVSGDTVLVKAGVYRESVEVKSAGRYAPGKRQPVWPYEPVPERITLGVFGDDKVVIDGSEPVDRKLWNPVEGRPGVYAAAMDVQVVNLAFFNGHRLTMCVKRADKGMKPVMPGSSDNGTFYFDAAGKKLYVHLGGDDPRKEGLVEAAVREQGIRAAYVQYVTVRGFTVRRVSGTGIEAGRSVDRLSRIVRFMTAAPGFHSASLIIPLRGGT